VWFKWYSPCLASSKPWIQTPVPSLPPKKYVTFGHCQSREGCCDLICISNDRSGEKGPMLTHFKGHRGHKVCVTHPAQHNWPGVLGVHGENSGTFWHFLKCFPTQGAPLLLLSIFCPNVCNKLKLLKAWTTGLVLMKVHIWKWKFFLQVLLSVGCGTHTVILAFGRQW
jgi:hypothetical protein